MPELCFTLYSVEDGEIMLRGRRSQALCVVLIHANGGDHLEMSRDVL